MTLFFTGGQGRIIFASLCVDFFRVLFARYPHDTFIPFIPPFYVPLSVRHDDDARSSAAWSYTFAARMLVTFISILCENNNLHGIYYKNTHRETHSVSLRPLFLSLQCVTRVTYTSLVSSPSNHSKCNAEIMKIQMRNYCSADYFVSLIRASVVLNCIYRIVFTGRALGLGFTIVTSVC